MPNSGVDESSHLNFAIVINENYIDGFRKTKGPKPGAVRCQSQKQTEMFGKGITSSDK